MSERNITITVDELEELRRCLSVAKLNRLAVDECPQGEKAIGRMLDRAEHMEQVARDIARTWARRGDL